MGERKLCRVEALAVKQTSVLFFKGGLSSAVDRIAHQRVGNGAHVYANLVGSACFQAHLSVGEAVEALQHPIVGNGLSCVGRACGINGHSLSVGFVTGDGGVNRAFIRLQISGYNGVVHPSDVVCFKQGREKHVGVVVFGTDQKTAGVLVDAMNDAGSDLAVDAGGNVSDLGGYYNELAYFCEKAAKEAKIEQATLADGVSSLSFLLKKLA
jgi:hypothetical protein